MIQMKNKNKKQEEIKGENVGIDLATQPKGRVGLPHRALIGGAQPVWLVGPCRPRYKEREGCRGSHNEVRRRHKPLLQKPYRSREACGRREAPQPHHDNLADPISALRRQLLPLEARRAPVPTTPSFTAGSVPRRPRLPRHHWSHGAPGRLQLLCAASCGWFGPPSPISLFLSLHVIELGMNHSLMYLEFVFPMPDLEHRLDLVSILEL